MNNVFNVPKPEMITDKYDLKGSLYKRQSTNEQIHKGAAKKDLNFLKDNFKINLKNEKV